MSDEAPAATTPAAENPAASPVAQEPSGGAAEGPSGEAAEEQSLRRLLLIALVVVAAAAAAALAIALTGEHGATPAPPPVLPHTFKVADNAAPSHLVAVAAGKAGKSSLVSVWHVTSGPAVLVARCDRGMITVTAGPVSVTQVCTGAPFQLVSVRLPKLTLGVRAKTTLPQARRWAVGLYR